MTEDEIETRTRMLEYARMLGARIGEVVGEAAQVEFPDMESVLDWCSAAAYDAAEYKPALVSLALALGTPDRAAAWVQENIEWSDEPGERLSYPTTTLRRGRGDCDCSAILTCSLCLAQGYPALVAALCLDDDPVHAACGVLWGGRPLWLETTEAVGPLPWEAHPMDRDARGGTRSVILPRMYRRGFPDWTGKK